MSFFGGSAGGRGRGGRGFGAGGGAGGGRGRGRSVDEDKEYQREKALGKSLNPLTWSPEDLTPFQKDFSENIKKSSNPERQLAKTDEFYKENKIRVVDPKGEKFCAILKFEHAGYPPAVLEGCKKRGFESPTPIQAVAWPIVLTGRDCVGLAETGSGKTLAFALPALVHIKAQKEQRAPRVLVLAPTRELAMQIDTETAFFANFVGVRTACIYGGAPRRLQAQQLFRGANIVVGTPGRLIDFLESKTLNTRHVTLLVLDEADRMLDMGFGPQLNAIVSQLRPDRQTIMWSATWPVEVREMSSTFMKNPVKIVVNNAEDIKANHNVQQYFHFVRPAERTEKLLQLVTGLQSKSPGRILIFAGTKHAADSVGYALQSVTSGILVQHGDVTQDRRQNNIEVFRSNPKAIMVATDVAQRGLDIKDLAYVINFDMPNDIEDYIHRIGRTGRAGAKGEAHSFMTNDTTSLAPQLVKLLADAKQDVPPELKEAAAALAAARFVNRSRWGQRGRGGGGGGFHHRYGPGRGAAASGHGFTHGSGRGFAGGGFGGGGGGAGGGRGGFGTRGGGGGAAGRGGKASIKPW